MEACTCPCSESLTGYQEKAFLALHCTGRHMVAEEVSGWKNDAERAAGRCGRHDFNSVGGHEARQRISQIMWG